MTDHLGNVTMLLSDRRTGNLASATLAAKILYYNQYYPFGWDMPGRTFVTGAGVRFGFNAQEKNPEIGEGLISYKYRFADLRTGRMWSVDPLAPEYPWNSTYAISENRLIDGAELEGLEWDKKIEWENSAYGGVSAKLEGGIILHSYDDDNEYALFGGNWQKIPTVSAKRPNYGRVLTNKVVVPTINLALSAAGGSGVNSGNRVLKLGNVFKKASQFGKSVLKVFKNGKFFTKNTPNLPGRTLYMKLLPWDNPKLKELITKFPMGKTYEIAKHFLESTIKKVKELRQTVKNLKDSHRRRT